MKALLLDFCPQNLKVLNQVLHMVLVVQLFKPECDQSECSYVYVLGHFI